MKRIKDNNHLFSAKMMNEKIVEFSGAVVSNHLQSPFFIVLFLYLTVSESGTVQIKLRMIFQVILNTCFSPKIKVS